MSAPARKLLDQVSCPYCWTSWRPIEARFLAESQDLVGDAVLGRDSPLRFLPTRYTNRGHALDPNGAVCTRIACPNCHLEVPAPVLEQPQVTVSIVGAPAAGKSVMLAAATFALRSGLVVPGLQFVDIDPRLNDLTIGMESRLFKSEKPGEPAMIQKTEVSGKLYWQYRSGLVRKMAPKPQLFSVCKGPMRSILALYDNAGEHFLPGADAAGEQATHHLGASGALVVVIDPTQDVRVYSKLGGADAVVAKGGGAGSGFRADLILIEVVNRIRRLRGLASSDPIPARLIIALSKLDLWGRLAPNVTQAAQVRPGQAVLQMPSAEVLADVHVACKEFLEASVPELVAAATAVSPDFQIIPFSGLGSAPQATNAGSQLLIRPIDVKPLWAAAPIVLGLQSAAPEAFTSHAEAVA